MQQKNKEEEKVMLQIKVSSKKAIFSKVTTTEIKERVESCFRNDFDVSTD